jgi:hypothetical protein
MYLEFHHRDWIALINKILKTSGHQRIHIKNVHSVDQSQVCFVTTQGAHIVAPTFTTIHGHGIGFLSLLRVLHHDDSVTWEPLTGTPTHNAKLIVLNHHNFTPVLYPSLAQLDHWLVRQYQQDAQFHIEPFHDDITAGLIAEHPMIVDIQRKLSYPII